LGFYYLNKEADLEWVYIADWMLSGRSRAVEIKDFTDRHASRPA